MGRPKMLVAIVASSRYSPQSCTTRLEVIAMERRSL
jgi:hypothetical protein